jgi:pyridoxamine 5'-phosphate oxidase
MADRELREHDVDRDPLVQVARWVDEAKDSGVVDFDAMVVATTTPDGEPSARVVLLRGVDEHGLRFYSNYDSRKGRELTANPRAALVLHWREQGRQVRITGGVTRMSPEESVAYWDARPRASRLSAWASRQSEPVADRAALEQAVRDVGTRFGDEEKVPLPEFWGGYLVTPDEVELWQHRDDRLHDRLRYRRASDGAWQLDRLQP